MKLSDFIKSYLPITKVGSYFFALCPFHTEKTPSLSINDVKDFFFCFCCGVFGNRHTFLSLFKQKFENYKEKNTKHKSIYLKSTFFLEKVKTFYVEQLFNDNNFFIFNYLCFFRKFSFESINFFCIGFAPNSWLFLTDRLAKSDFSIAKNVGILNCSKWNRYYDFFRFSIILPIRSLNGFIVGFGARNIIRNSFSKYTNLKNTQFFIKSKEFYCFYESLMLFKKFFFLIVVEGYFDAIRILQDVSIPCVSLLGLRCSEYFFNNTKKFTKNYLFCFDGDIAGLNFCFFLLRQFCFFFVFNVFFLLLPYKHDPDTYIFQNGKFCFLLKLKFSYSYLLFIFSYLIFFDICLNKKYLSFIQFNSSVDRKKYIFFYILNYIENFEKFFNINVLKKINLNFSLLMFFFLFNRYYMNFITKYFLIKFKKNFLLFFKEILFLLKCNWKISISKIFRRVFFFSNHLVVFLYVTNYYNIKTIQRKKFFFL